MRLELGPQGPDGRAIHDSYLFRVKKPEDSKGEWDLYETVATIPADKAFRPLADGGCSLVKDEQRRSARGSAGGTAARARAGAGARKHDRGARFLALQAALGLGNVYGPRQLIKHNRQGFIGWFIRLAVEGGQIEVYGDGSQMRDFVYVDDAVDAFTLAAEKLGVNRSGMEFACIQGWGIFDGPSDAASVEAGVKAYRNAKVRFHGVRGFSHLGLVASPRACEETWPEIHRHLAENDGR